MFEFRIAEYNTEYNEKFCMKGIEMKNQTKNILIGGGVIAAGTALAVGASHFLINKLVGAAMDRSEPKAMNKNRKKIEGSPALAEIVEEQEIMREKLLAADTETLEITSRDGLRLIGHYYPCQKADRIIIAMHGWRTTWARDFGFIADFWHENGCSILFAEQRAQGGSEGEYMSFGINERYDCLDWVNYVNDHITSALPIYLCGLSMGGTTVLMTAGLELPENVRGVIADCAFTSPHDIWKHVLTNNLKLPYTGLEGIFADEASKRRSGFKTKDYSTVDAMKECRVPVLFIHGSDDTFVPIDMTYRNYKACAAPKKLLVVPGADHGMSYIVNRSEYEKVSIDFWKENDKQRIICV